MRHMALVLTCFALLMAGGALVADSTTVPLYAGFNCVSASLVPLSPSPTDVFSSQDILGGKLYRWDAASQGYVTYSSRNPSKFGAVLMGDGIWLRADAGIQPLHYNCGPDGLCPDSTDMADFWVSLPTTGYTMFGHPFAHSVKLADCDVTDGNDTYSFQVAASAGWIEGYCWSWNNATQGWDRIIPSGHGTLTLEPYRGYQLRSTRDKLALIIPAYPKP